MKKPFKFALLSAAIISLAGCTAAFLDTAAHGIFLQEETKLLEKNYAAADYLVQQARHFAKDDDLVVALTLTDIDQPDMTSEFGRLVPEQVGTRLAQLGYNMNMKNVAAVETNYVGYKPVKGERTDFYLGGNYKRNRADMDISLKMTDANNGQIVAVFNYSLPMTRDIADMTQPKPIIMRLEPSQGAAYGQMPSAPVTIVESTITNKNTATTATPPTPAEPFR
ncbi:MAG: hypothetical protein KTR28_07915 [Micavibrio sp.]|nr:hypothetical protein [Micavibrio sp.]